jgi:hypothetical protein
MAFVVSECLMSGANTHVLIVKRKITVPTGCIFNFSWSFSCIMHQIDYVNFRKQHMTYIRTVRAWVWDEMSLCGRELLAGRYMTSWRWKTERRFSFSADKSIQQWQTCDTASGDSSTFLFTPATFRLPPIREVWQLTAHVGWIWYQSLNTFPSFYRQHIGPWLK